MIEISVNTRRAVVTNKEDLTVGSAGIQVQFTLSEDWNSLSKLAVFRVGDEGTRVEVVLGESLTCVVPPEVLTVEDEPLFIGVYGANEQGTIIIPTIWTSAGVVRPGTEPNTPASAEPTPVIWAQILCVATDAEQTAAAAMSNVEAGLQELSALENTIQNAEDQRQANEQTRIANETERVAAETERSSAENSRGVAEAARESAEATRVVNEQNRQTAEQNRQTAEQGRVTAEEGRVAAEEYREEKYAEYVTTVEGYAEAASASATAANTSMLNASLYASSASDYATQARNYEMSAMNYAGAASTSASNADSAARTAVAEATTATGAAGTATTKAGEAAASATAAGNAQTAAETAQTAAETAQQAAEEAAGSIEESAAQIAQNTQDISDVKNALPNTYVALAGENQVTPQNIAGMQFTKTEEAVDGENIFSADMLFREGQYVISSDGTVSIGTNASFNAYCVPVEQNSTYVFPECRFVVLTTGNTVNSPTVGDTITYASQVETSNATYLFLSYADKPVSEITVKKRETSVVYTNFILPDWLNQKPIEKPKFKSASGSLSDGSTLIVKECRNNTRKGERVTFYGNITSFNSISFGISISESAIATGVRNTFTIDGTNITYTESPYSTPVVVQHGLTIADNIQIIGEENATGTYTITVVSGGSLFTHEFNYSQKVIGAPYVHSVGSVITDAKLSWTCTDLDKQIWMFGDSYFAYSIDRWTYYLHEYGYDQNCLLDGWSGMGSVNARVSFFNLLAYGTPRFAVWCMGMNDGGDSGATPSTDWSAQRDIFLQYCNENEVTPIFATIPTVPSINNEAKNAWVRSSGYRYIDFALAVGASSSGAWYSGMLSSDNVHPTEKGAKALFARFLVDFPEIMIEQ